MWWGLRFPSPSVLIRESDPFPLDLGPFEKSAGTYPGGSEPPPSYWTFKANGELFNLAVWIGPKASTGDRQAMEEVVASINFPTSLQTPDGYYLLFPEAIEATTDSNGGANVTLTTNLPEATLALNTYQDVGGSAGGLGLGDSVHDGKLTVTVFNQSCYDPPGAQGSSGFELTVTIRPVFDNVPLEGPPPAPGQSPRGPPSQPDSVLAILGQRFENLNGDQVTKDGEVNQIVVTRSYDWPPDSCAANRQAGAPDECKAEYGEAISEDQSAEAVAGQVLGPILQSQLCELWGAATAEFQAAHPWLEFRDTWRAWIDGLGSLAGPPGNTFDGPLHVEIVGESSETFEAPTGGHNVLPERFVADYFYDNRKVAEVEFVHTGPNAPTAVPQFRFDRFDLF